MRATVFKACVAAAALALFAAATQAADIQIPVQDLKQDACDPPPPPPPAE